MTQTQTYTHVSHKNRKHAIMFMIKSIMRKSLNGINNLILYKFTSNKDKKKMLKWYFIFNFAKEKKEVESHVD